MRESNGRSLYLKRGFLARIFLVGFVIAFILQSFLIPQPSIAHANQFSWSGSADPSVVSAVQSDVPAIYCQVHQTINVAGAGQKDVCLSEAGNVQFGTYYNGGASYIPVIRFADDTNMYNLNGVCGGFNNCLYLPTKDILITKQYLIPGTVVESLAIYKNFSARLTRTVNQSNFVTEYNFNSANPDYIFKSADNYPWPVGALSASDNGEWLVFEARERAIMLLNTDNFNIKRVSVQLYRYGIGSDPGMEFDVTNDGTHIAMMGHNTETLVFDVSDSCGDIPTDEQLQDNKPIATPCPSKNLNDFSTNFIERFNEGHSPKFNTDGGELTFYATSYSVPSKLVTLQAAGYQARTLDYLALGDSYSSGEGDTELTSSGQKYYLAWTDINGEYENNIPREKCHQSLRAYPFLLADDLRLSDDKKETVACSGATIGDIAGSKPGYEGQYNGGEPNKPRLQGLPNIPALQNTALEEFIPGRVRQIEFMKKYKPKAITVGVSGNDMGFADVIRDCTINSVFTTCEEADGARGTAGLGKKIASQYDSLVALYTRLHQASPETKIYAVNYPKFVSINHSCGYNVQLGDSEREMAEKSVEYLNTIIERAARRAGVGYLNIENSLDGRRLCDTSKPYVTGIAGHAPFTTSEEQESFHPNSKGNELMANAIISELKPDNLLTYRNCPLPLVLDFCPDSSVNPPDPNSYFADAMSSYDRLVKNEQLTNDTVDKTSPQKIQTDPFSLQPESTVTIELHSNPINLGEYTVQQDGSLSENIIIPTSVPAGYHTLHIYGNSYSGEPIDLTQIIEVQGSQGDIDEDGIVDNIDPCLYVPAANVDADFDGIDDACDPEIDDVQPYRVRNGGTNKNEQTSYLYIERNTHASAVTGITGDYDPDNDGWAVVATSNNKNNSGLSAHFWIDDTKIPHVSIRTDNKGCVQFTPRSLKVVKPNQARNLKREAINTNTCRSEPATDDVDKNDVPDNEQTLYRVHNGQPATNEDPQSIYLERSSTAAEAQLGLSDYDHKNSWNLLASSQNDATKATFVKLIIVNDDSNKPQPIILANKTTTNKKGVSVTTCIALEPANIGVIKQLGHDKINFKKLNNLPLGQNCT